MSSGDATESNAFLAHVNQWLQAPPNNGDEGIAFWDMLKHLFDVGNTCCLTLYEDENPRQVEILVRNNQGFVHRVNQPWPAGLDAWRLHWDQHPSARYIQPSLRPYLHMVCRFQNAVDLPCITWRVLERPAQAVEQETTLEKQLPVVQGEDVATPQRF